jgi:molybdate transport system substrate-binding protein
MDFVLFSGGAAHGLVSAVEAEFGKRTGAVIVGSYGAVGVYRDKFLAGNPADMLILSRVLIDQLAADGHVAATDVHDIGAVRTAIAVRSGDPEPDVSSEGSAAGGYRYLFSRSQTGDSRHTFRESAESLRHRY